MNEYYYLDANNERKGPIAKEELLSQKLNKETLVWREGLENWTPMKDVAELAEAISQKTPPPLPTNSNNKKEPPAISVQATEHPKIINQLPKAEMSQKEVVTKRTPQKKGNGGKIAVIIISVFIVLIGLAVSGIYLYEKHETESRVSGWKSNERSNPSNYISINSATVYGTGYLQCSVFNSSSYTTYNNIEVKITYYDKNDNPIDTEYVTLPNTISPFQTIDVNQFIPYHSNKLRSKYIETQIINAHIVSQE